MEVVEPVLECHDMQEASSWSAICGRGLTTALIEITRAEEVARVFPELVTVDPEGRPESVRYDLLAPLLLNEIQSLHRRLQVLEARLDGAESRPSELTDQILRP